MNVYLTAASDVGKERASNEDSFCVCPDLEKGVWTNSQGYEPLGRLGALSMVADGMGGLNAGDVASALSVESVMDRFSAGRIDRFLRSGESVQSWMTDTIKEANAAILDHARNNPESIGMGTTVLLLWLVGDLVHIAWCGDCRCYLYRKGVGLRRLTKDHSYVQGLVDDGKIGADDAFNHPDNNLITRGLGDIDVSSEPDYISLRAEDGDVFLSCSDGLCGYCKDGEIEQIVTRNIQDMNCCRDELVRAALTAGGCDNVTVALLSTGETPKGGVKSFIKRLFSNH